LKVDLSPLTKLFGDVESALSVVLGTEAGGANVLGVLLAAANGLDGEIDSGAAANGLGVEVVGAPNGFGAGELCVAKGAGNAFGFASCEAGDEVAFA
jgi:hypothetical protein